MTGDARRAVQPAGPRLAAGALRVGPGLAVGAPRRQQRQRPQGLAPARAAGRRARLLRRGGGGGIDGGVDGGMQQQRLPASCGQAVHIARLLRRFFELGGHGRWAVQDAALSTFRMRLSRYLLPGK